jgi:hypothetical protein
MDIMPMRKAIVASPITPGASGTPVWRGRRGSECATHLRRGKSEDPLAYANAHPVGALFAAQEAANGTPGILRRSGAAGPVLFFVGL